jgi:hypothetical protein
MRNAYPSAFSPTPAQTTVDHGDPIDLIPSESFITKLLVAGLVIGT